MSTVSSTKGSAPPTDAARPTPSSIGRKPRRPYALSSLVRITPYLAPDWWKFALMFVLDGAAVFVAIAIPLITREMIDGPVKHGDRGGVVLWGLLALVIGVVAAVLVFVRRWMVSRAIGHVENRLRIDMFARLQQLPMDFHRSWESGQLLSRIMSDLSLLRRFYAFGLAFFVLNAVQIVVVTALLLQMYWPLGVLVLCMVFPVALVMFLLENRLWRVSREIQDRGGDLTSNVEESFQGLRVIRAFGRRRFAEAKFARRSGELRDAWLRRVNLTSWFWTALGIVPNLTLVAVVALGGFAAVSGHVTIGTLVAFVTLLLSLVWPMSSMGFLITMIQESGTAAERVCEVFDAENFLVSGTETVANPAGRLEFRDVSYQFADADEPVLHGVNLTLEPGETIAIVGGTGSGKSTLTALVPRLIDVTEGQVLVDGVDVRELDLRHLRSLVATAFEEPTLFSMSVRENLTLGRPSASEEDIRRAIDVAQAHFVDELPWGLDTRIGEQGMSLSGGQRQRLALARAVITGPRILVLDDTLSALDIHTEALVEEALGRVLNGVTAMIVAHRASTVLLADRVAMISEGTVSHVGTHEQLLRDVPEYRELLSADFHIEEELDYLEREVQHG